MSIEQRIAKLQRELELLPKSLLSHDLFRKNQIYNKLSDLRRQQLTESQTGETDFDL